MSDFKRIIAKRKRQDFVFKVVGILCTLIGIATLGALLVDLIVDGIGRLDFGFLTGNSGNFNSGSVNDGLAPGESASFTVSGAAFAGFTEEQICNAIFVRFQNVPLEGGSEGSDVGVPGEIPEPSSILLLGSALVGLGGYARKKLNRK